MGLSVGKLLLNPRKPKLAPVEVEVLADSGAVHLPVLSHPSIRS